LYNFIIDEGPDIYVYDDATWLATLPRSNHSHVDMNRDNQLWVNMHDQLAQQMWDEWDQN
jgi:hypothetical protein